MSFAGLLLIAVGVSADAFAVSLTMGVKMRQFAWKYILTIALVFGGFQALMPLIGWLLGDNFLQYISAVDHWVAFGLLALVGGKMLWEAFERDEEERVCSVCLEECTCEESGVVGANANEPHVASAVTETHPGQVALAGAGNTAGEAVGGIATIERPQTQPRAYPKLAVGSLIMLGIAESIDALAVGITFPVANVNVWAAITLIGIVTTVLSALAVWLGHKLGAKFSKPAEIVGGLILIAIGIQVLVEHLG